MFFKELIGKKDYWHPNFPYRACDLEEYETKYFLDFSEKANYPLELREGIPILNLKGIDYEFSITILNYGLGLIDSDSHQNKIEILKVYNWLKLNMDNSGGIRNFTPLPKYGLENGWYSCLTQGLCLSFLARCINLGIGDDIESKELMKLLFQFMKKPIINQETPFGKILQEFESSETSVLNGYIFGIFGLYDYAMVTGESDFYADHIANLKKIIHHFELPGGWTYYNLKGVIASRFYHNLHVNMMYALFKITGDIDFYNLAIKWQRGLKFRIFYLIFKSVQKLKTLKFIHVLQN